MCTYIREKETDWQAERGTVRDTHREEKKGRGYEREREREREHVCMCVCV